MDYSQTLDYLYRKLPMFSRIGSAAIKKGLKNILTLCEALGNPQHRFKSIHIAGTNGKGSTSHMLAAVLQQAGYKTGLYTSPHLHDFRERIRINGTEITPDAVVQFVQEHQGLIESVKPSFFEITVALAYDWFAQNEVDVAVIEVGLGGRLDSTNIIIPELSVITNIGWDHMQILGDTLPEIAQEKAGIIKPGIPVVIGETHPETEPVFRRIAEERQAEIYFADQVWAVQDWQQQLRLMDVWLQRIGKTDEWHLQLDLPGMYQLKNSCTVMESLMVLRSLGWQIPDSAIRQGFLNSKDMTGLRGRWDLVTVNPRVIMDVAHNKDGMTQVVTQLEMTDYHHLHVVIGMVKDKDVRSVLELLPRRATYYFTQADVPRALPASQLKELAVTFGLNGHEYPKSAEALKAAKDAAGVHDLVLVCGSVFLVGELIHS